LVAVTGHRQGRLAKGSRQEQVAASKVVGSRREQAAASKAVGSKQEQVAANKVVVATNPSKTGRKTNLNNRARSKVVAISHGNKVATNLNNNRATGLKEEAISRRQGQVAANHK